MTPTTSLSRETEPAPQRTRGARCAAGMVAAALCLGVAQLVAGGMNPAAAPYLVVGNTIVDHAPDGVREYVIATFGISDKMLLLTVLGMVIAGLSALAGLLETRTSRRGSVMFAAAGVIGVICALTRPAAAWTWALPTLIGVTCGIWLLRRQLPRESNTERTGDRRRVLWILGAGAGVGIASWITGFFWGRSRVDIGADRARFTVPTPTNSLALQPDTEQPGISPYITSNADFYRIDTALSPPLIRSADWSLRIHGMVDKEVRITAADLARMPAIEKTVTLTCVSNEVGGDLIGNARWTGYRLKDILAQSVPHADADMVLSMSSDGFTAGTPLTAMIDDRDALLAVAMNGEPLPVEHGYPARLVIPGLYGYVSATKWVTDLEVTRFDKATAYWTARGWSAKGPIKIASRIDTPRSGSILSAGTITVGGVAWAQHRGIGRVQVRVDDGPWQDAVVEAPDDIDTWRLWRWDWPASTGAHSLNVRAFDHNGVVQTSAEASPVPDGATGFHRVSVRVR